MYVTLFIILGIFIGMAFAIAQIKVLPTDSVHQTERALKMREEIHRRIMDKLINGVGSDENLFGDMDLLMEESMKDMGRFQMPEAVAAGWSESSAGRTLTVKPASPDQKLDINIQNRLITIKGQNETKSPTGAISSQSFSQSYSVPNDCDEKKVKMSQENGSIVMFFPYENLKAEPRKPLPKSSSDVQI